MFYAFLFALIAAYTAAMIVDIYRIGSEWIEMPKLPRRTDRGAVDASRRRRGSGDIMSPARLERHLRAALFRIAPGDLPTPREARALYASTRARFGFSEIPGLFLSDETDIAKLTEGEGEHAVALSLPPADSSGIAQLCAFRDHCVAGCVGEGGSNRYDSAKRGKAARLALWIDHPGAALALLVAGLEKFDQPGAGVACRLNTYSDIRWERILPAWFWEKFARVRFYDYTKHPLRSRPVDTLPTNYRLTYSVSPRSSLAEVGAQRAAGRSVAVVVTTRGGKDRRTGEKRPLPIPADGTRSVDGDKNDRRYLDPPGAVVQLRRKNGLPADAPLVVSDARLAEILAE